MIGIKKRFWLILILGILFVNNSLQQNEEKKNGNEEFTLAQEYLNGKGEKNVYKAIELLEEAGKQGNDEALYTIGRIYEFAEGGISRNFTAAMSYYNRSAEFGNANAMEALGFMWGTGKGVSINTPLSLLYYAFAAHGDNTAAQMVLGYKYFYGHDVTQSCTKAANRYEQAAAKVVEGLEGIIGQSMFYHDHVRLSESIESKRDRNKEEADIVQYYQYSADTGDAHAQVAMGTLYLQGVYGVEKNFQKALSYFQKAAGQNDPGGLSNLGYMYANGHGVEQDNDTAIKYYLEAAEKKNPQAQTNLGYMYLHGYGVEKNVMNAFSYFRKAADQGYAEGQTNLAILYLNGEGTRKDYLKAITYFSLAAQQGNLIAMYYLGQMNDFGLGTSQSCPLAVQLYKRVAERGPWSSILDQAHELFQQGDYEGALLRYERAAEQGYEVAQSNAGWLYDRGLANLNEDKSSDARYLLAFEYFRNSAEQNNAESHLKIGDYYYHGLGTNKSLEKAAQSYQTSSDMKNAQATFNLGYMHQFGEGLSRDLHLAKRYYDLTLQIEPESWLAVYSVLIGVGFQFVVEWYQNGQLEIWGLQWDTILIILLTIILLVCIILRQNRQ